MRQIIVGVGFLSLFLQFGSSLASVDSIGPNGINSMNLGLTGNGIAIGQVEDGRPGSQNVDTDPGAGSLYHTAVTPADVFRRHPQNLGFTANANNGAEITAHAVEVAGLMISTHPVATGLAPEADLFSVGIVPTGPTQEDVYAQTAISAQHIATLPGQDVRAINMSLALGPAQADPNGSSTLTQFVDWSAREHDVLYVVAGLENGASGPIPSDNFNGITVGTSAKVGTVYRQVDTTNVTAGDGNRALIDLIAPGRNIQMATVGDMITPVPDPTHVGTSFAAPHVTGTVALLQQFAETQIADPNTDLDANAHRHEVMKAVLLNSADKIKDDGMFDPPGPQGPILMDRLLGMERTVLKEDGMSTWFNSPAHTNSQIPLDIEMGAGHLNAKRALQQFLPGEFEPDDDISTSVPPIGWDFGHTSFQDDFNRYLINTPLTAGHYISITLAWDRHVELTVDDGSYSVGDVFEDSMDPDSDDLINDLDIFLVPRDTFAQERESNSFVGTTEHLFTQVPFDGEYEIWVIQQDQDVPGGQDYGLAWWYGLAPSLGVPGLGDFDRDNDVDGTDLAQWEGDYGLNADSDADGDGDSDGTDFLIWQRNFGTGTLAGTAAVPEPGAGVLAMVGMLLAVRRRR